MGVKFLHTADWQLGKPFAGVADLSKRVQIQNERIAVVHRLAAIAREKGAKFVLVAGDLFDSPSATKATVSAACSAIGAFGIPVLAIPGNHDHGGPGSLWQQDFFQREREQLAPNLRILLKPEPVELPGAILFPCPLLRRHETGDVFAWLRSSEDLDSRFGPQPRIVLAHGSVLNFSAAADPDEINDGACNLLDLASVPDELFDYVALGDWHGTKQVGLHAWYAGTPEADRFLKGCEHNPGNALLVEVARHQPPRVECVRTGKLNWHEMHFCFDGDEGLDRLQAQVAELMGTRTNQDLLWLHLSGSLGIEASARLEQWLETCEARLLRIKQDNQTTISPSAPELLALTQRPGDPLLSRVTGRLMGLATGSDERAVVARIALREIHAVVRSL